MIANVRKRHVAAVASGAVLMFLSITQASAQANFVTPGGANVDGKLEMCLNGSSLAVPCSATVPLPVTPSAPSGTQDVNVKQYNSSAVGPTNPVDVEIAPTGAPGNGITPVVSAAAESSHVLKASAGNLYGVYVANPSATGFLMVFNSTTVPVDGAVTPIHCVPVQASNVAFINFGTGPPEPYSTGISAALSSTGCFTKTTSPTGFFHGSVK